MQLKSSGQTGDVRPRVLVSVSSLNVLEHAGRYLKCAVTSLKHVAAYFPLPVFKDKMKLVAACLKNIGQYFVTHDCGDMNIK